MTATTDRKYDIVDRCTGSILGTAFGDALGAGVEGWTSAEIENEYGEVREYIDTRMGAGYYTDDTQMTLAMLRSIVRTGKIDGADCAASCAEAFEPERGYGRSASEIMQALNEGASYTETGEMLFPGGSYGNGAAMRIAPVGLLCGKMDPALMRSWVFESVRATHTHDEAVDGALVLAVVIGNLSRLADASTFDPPAFLLGLSPYCRTMELRSRIMLAARLLGEELAPEEVVEQLGNGVRTLESVPTALYTAFKHIENPEQALIAAVGYGGDTDTVAAMTGAVVGALHGADVFPRRWHDGLERGSHGYETLRDLSVQLAKIVK